MSTARREELRAPSTLFLMVTYECNLRCRYCLVRRDPLSLSREVAFHAIDRFVSSTPDTEKTLRVFGGEPLLHAEVVREMVDHALDCARHSPTTLRMDVTTNGTLLKDEILDFFEARPEVELIVSLDGTRRSHETDRRPMPGWDSYNWVASYARRLASMSNVCVNKVISPNNVHTLLRDFYYLFRLGFRRINLLPAFFNCWPQESLSVLEARLSGLTQLIQGLRKRDARLHIKNLDICNAVPLFSDGVLVDVDGCVYRSNLAVCRTRRRLKKALLLGHISDPDVFRGNGKGSVDRLVTSSFSKDVCASTRAVDALLTSFVGRLEPQAANRMGPAST